MKKNLSALLRRMKKIRWSWVGLVSVAVLFFGQGVFVRPDVVVSCGAIDLGIPAKYYMEMMLFRSKLVPPAVIQEIRKNLEAELIKLGMNEEKAKAICKSMDIESSDRGEKEIKSFGLQPYEERILTIAVMRELMGPLLRHISLGVTMLPKGVLFFRIENKGFASAQNAHIVIRLKGSPYNKQIESENLIKSETLQDDCVIVDLDSISPGSVTKGVVWYSASQMPSEKLDSVPSLPKVEKYHHGYTF